MVTDKKTPKSRLSITLAVESRCINLYELFGCNTCWMYPAGIYWLKVNNRNTRTECEVCSKLRIKTPERRHFAEQ